MDCESAPPYPVVLGDLLVMKSLGGGPPWPLDPTEPSNTALGERLCILNESSTQDSASFLTQALGQQSPNPKVLCLRSLVVPSSVECAWNCETQRDSCSPFC